MHFAHLANKLRKDEETNTVCRSTGVFAAITLAVHVKYTRDQWTTWSNHLRALMLLGCLGQLAAVCAFAVYLTLAISQHQRSSPDSSIL